MGKVLTGVQIGLEDGDIDFPAYYLADKGKMVINLGDHTSLVAHSPGALHNLADTLKGHAEEWDAKEANRADVQHPDINPAAMTSDTYAEMMEDRAGH